MRDLQDLKRGICRARSGDFADLGRGRGPPSILIDEARTPLIISAPAAENPDSYYQFAKIAAQLTPDDYTLEEKHKQVALSDDGVRFRCTVDFAVVAP